MKVYIEQQVHWRIEDFYENALLRHETLDEVTVMKKVHRLYDALESLGTYARIYPWARFREAGEKKEYRKYIGKVFNLVYQ